MMLGIAFALGAYAAEPVSPPQTATDTSKTVTTTKTKTSTATPVAAGLGSRVDSSVLANLSGGSDVSEHITITGNVSNTSTENVSTGMNWIGGGSFGNTAGLPIVIQNTGNSVLIQNATIVNVQMQP